MERYISVVIPNYNMAAVIGRCLEAAFETEYENFEVIVVDDCSDDNSVEVIEGFPCRLIRLEERSGASKARNTGALNSRGEIIFFTDADCLLLKDTLSAVNRAFSEAGPDVIIGGTYTRIPYDRDFFSTFQSVFINYSETKNAENPDYIAAHALVIDARTFRDSGGFPEDFLPIIEDVEYCHRLRRSGCRLVMKPDIQVRHIFDFSLSRSLRNAFRKSKYWSMYSLKNRDMLADSGTASTELKTNVASYCLNLLLLSLWVFVQKSGLLFLVMFVLIINIFINRRLFRAFFETKGALFGAQAVLYYTALYPLPVCMGTAAAVMEHFRDRRR
ncbi:MAG: glycosyltransferase family 2 protein [Deferribacteres bacterium]|nr:glycosyltransferase family 2 protein [Deferribacteres bacterium]